MHERHIYPLLCQGYAQSKIARLLHVDKAHVSRITTKLLHEKYIQCVNPHGKPKLYQPTAKPYPLTDVYVDKGRRVGNLQKTMRAHVVSRSYLLTSPPKIHVNWDNMRVTNGTTFCDMKRIFDIGLITLRFIKGCHDKNKYGQIVIWMPEKLLTSEQLKIGKKILDDCSQHVANWFMKTYHCRLKRLGTYQETEYAIIDPDFASITTTLKSKSGKCWVDASQGTPEWETNDIELAKIKLELPERVLALETTVEKLTESVERLLEIFDTPSRPDDFEDVT